MPTGGEPLSSDLATQVPNRLPARYFGLKTPLRPPIPQITPTQSRINHIYNSFAFNSLTRRPQGISRLTWYPKSDKANNDQPQHKAKDNHSAAPAGDPKAGNPLTDSQILSLKNVTIDE